MVQSLTDPDDFRRLLQRRPLARHAGWSLHAQRSPSVELSTGETPGVPPRVDDPPKRGPGGARATLASGVDIDRSEAGCHVFSEVRTGVVLSRRNVRRATSRNLMRRIWREQLRQGPVEGLGGWDLLVRRTAPWSRTDFPSTQSDPMRSRLRAEFDFLLAAWLAARERA